jgi:hypothetical protein
MTINPAPGVERLRKVSLPLQCRRHHVLPHAAGLPRLRVLDRIEEEQVLVVRGVEETRDLERPAGARAVGVVVVDRRRQVVALVVPRVGVPLVAARVVVAGAGVAVAAALGDDLDVRAAASAVLGLVAAEHHLHFRDRVQIGGRREAIRAAQLVAVESVDSHLVPGPPLAADVGDL